MSKKGGSTAILLVALGIGLLLWSQKKPRTQPPSSGVEF